MPAHLLDCSFASAINLTEATTLSVRLGGSHVPAVRAEQLLTRGDPHLDRGFSVSGGVELEGAHIGGQLGCRRGNFSNTGGLALTADGLTVDQDMFCNKWFSANGEARLVNAHITGQLNCRGGQFSNTGGSALDLEIATVSGPLLMESAVLQGRLDLNAATMSSYRDNLESWTQKLCLDRFVYDAIEGASAKERLE